MLFTDLGEYQLLFQDHILTVILWVSAWGLLDIFLDHVTGNSKLLRVLILSILFITSSIAISKLSKEAQIIERQELRSLISEIRSH